MIFPTHTVVGRLNPVGISFEVRQVEDSDWTGMVEYSSGQASVGFPVAIFVNICLACRSSQIEDSGSLKAMF